ncbi:MAG: hypothetical protein HYZ27_12145, partial [Deltaproteobacteria bacterium]|nr:hypothetical protein [Deltaproteobacteria bacterium]
AFPTDDPSLLVFSAAAPLGLDDGAETIWLRGPEGTGLDQRSWAPSPQGESMTLLEDGEPVVRGAPGQAAVIYRGARVLGGGTIGLHHERHSQRALS